MLEASSARCAEHAAPAIGACERCGTFVCSACGFSREGHVRCHRCGAPPAERPPGITTAALALSALGMVCAPLSLLGIGLALAWRLGGDRDRSATGAQYARWALVLGLMSLAVGVGFGWLTWRMADALRSIPVDEPASSSPVSPPGPATP